MNLTDMERAWLSPDASSNQPLSQIILVSIATWLIWCLYSHLTSPLRKFPGPFFARHTRLWYLYLNWTGNAHLELERLHKKHGPVVRISPYMLSVDDPDMIPSVFNMKGDWLKTSWYHGSSTLVEGHIVYNLFSHTDPHVHARQRKPVAKFYSPAATAALEPHIDIVIKNFCEILEKRFIDISEEKKEFDLGEWVMFYTWDVIGSVTFSKPFGYLEQGCDFDGTLHAADKALDYFVVVGAMPILDRLFDKNPIFHIGPPGFNASTSISVQRLKDRYTGADKDYHDHGVPDFLDKFIEAKESNPENVDDTQIISWLMVNMIAGSDTTAITIRSAIYFSLCNPRVWACLTSAILAREFQQRDLIPPSYKEARAIPYVDAVVREALRILPGVSMPLERYVPPGGYTLPGTGDYLPEGIVVGMNPYISNRNKVIFGEDADEFRPERWLRDTEKGESEEAFQARLLAMNKADLSFGGGSRICIGKHLGIYQSYKVLVTLITLYEFELAADANWKVTCSWFPRQEGLRVRMRRR